MLEAQQTIASVQLADGDPVASLRSPSALSADEIVNKPPVNGNSYSNGQKPWNQQKLLCLSTL